MTKTEKTLHSTPTIHSSYQIKAIGIVHAEESTQSFWLEIFEPYRAALTELAHFSHLHIFWWGDRLDTPTDRKTLVSQELPDFYGEEAPPMGVFANRSEYRPNPILLTTCAILHIDEKHGKIILPWIDAMDGTPIIDLKPYLRMTDFIESSTYPSYLQHWPHSAEKAVQWWQDRMETS